MVYSMSLGEDILIDRKLQKYTGTVKPKSIPAEKLEKDLVAHIA